MKIGTDGQKIVIADVDTFAAHHALKAMGFKFLKRKQVMEGPATKETLSGLAKLFTLPPKLAAMLSTMEEAQNKVDQYRADPAPVPIVPPPVKATLYAHQVRGYNMALTVFGIEAEK